MTTLENNNKYVRWGTFVWAIGVIFLIFTIYGGMVLALNSRVDETNGDVVDIKVMLGEVQKDVSWIKDYFIKNGFKEE